MSFYRDSQGRVRPITPPVSQRGHHAKMPRSRRAVATTEGELRRERKALTPAERHSLDVMEGLPPDTNEYVKQGNDFLRNHQISFKAKQVNPEPFPGEPNGQEHDTYIVTFRKADGRSVSYRFHQSIANAGQTPTPYDVLTTIEKYNPSEEFSDVNDFAANMMGGPIETPKDRQRAERLLSRVQSEYDETAEFFTPTELDQAREIQ